VTGEELERGGRGWDGVNSEASGLLVVELWSDGDARSTPRVPG